MSRKRKYNFITSEGQGRLLLPPLLVRHVHYIRLPQRGPPPKTRNKATVSAAPRTIHSYSRPLARQPRSLSTSQSTSRPTIIIRRPPRRLSIMGDHTPEPAELAPVVAVEGSITRDIVGKRKRSDSTPRHDEKIETLKRNVVAEDKDAHSSGSATSRLKDNGKEEVENMSTPDPKSDTVVVGDDSQSSELATARPKNKEEGTILPNPQKIKSHVAMDAVLPDPAEFELEAVMDIDDAPSSRSATPRPRANDNGEDEAELPDIVMSTDDAKSDGSVTPRATARDKGKEKAGVPTHVPTAKVSL
ncbi:hypothetical protein P171DRAFT_522762 [Karstenula rhodostoma CBS 690.94]|uniref:Uncharacterized protein n=1 Tax=Karstenula rhodostoma CBS 690.94 TaxID=1392251 RepID=A0A9P4UAD3_9PLEO|nr:hypothetical protein P171DRAFT_522762 [Karstenula rhodostoma CBS 690.94]